MHSFGGICALFLIYYEKDNLSSDWKMDVCHSEHTYTTSKNTWKQISDQVVRSECNLQKGAGGVGEKRWSGIAQTNSWHEFQCYLSRTPGRRCQWIIAHFWGWALMPSPHPTAQYSRQPQPINRSYSLRWNRIYHIWLTAVIHPSHGAPFSAIKQRTLHQLSEFIFTEGLISSHCWD